MCRIPLFLSFVGSGPQWIELENYYAFVYACTKYMGRVSYVSVWCVCVTFGLFTFAIQINRSNRIEFLIVQDLNFLHVRRTIPIKCEHHVKRNNFVVRFAQTYLHYTPRMHAADSRVRAGWTPLMLLPHVFRDTQLHQTIGRSSHRH